MHNNEIIHGKITCESVYINSNNGELKIGDIGIKKIYAHAKNQEDKQIKLFFKEKPSK